jgi:hypothetical protein
MPDISGDAQLHLALWQQQTHTIVHAETRHNLIDKTTELLNKNSENFLLNLSAFRY